MTQIVLNVEDASLVPSLKQILGAIKGVTIGKLVTKDAAINAEKQFIADTQGRIFPTLMIWCLS